MTLINTTGNSSEAAYDIVSCISAIAQEDDDVIAFAPVAAAPAGGETITSPMPGTILAVNVQNGASVNKGDVLMVLEAMKMENEIIAPVSGTVASVNVQKGASVETGATLCVIA